jgi:hypothetical protein
VELGRKKNRTSKPDQERTTDKAHLREMVRKANEVVGCVWGIGEKKCGGDFKRRMMMFESMVESILMYGAEI